MDKLKKKKPSKKPQNALAQILFPFLKQTVGYLAKVKGFPVHKTSILENISAVCQDVMILCYFPNTRLDLLLASIRNGETPAVDLKAILTPQNCFWTFSQLYQELLEEHLSLFSNQE